jgi:hypothetical protein
MIFGSIRRRLRTTLCRIGMKVRFDRFHFHSVDLERKHSANPVCCNIDPYRILLRHRRRFGIVVSQTVRMMEFLGHLPIPFPHYSTGYGPRWLSRTSIRFRRQCHSFQYHPFADTPVVYFDSAY